MSERENLSVDSYDDALYVEIIPAVSWRDEYVCIKATEDGLDDEVHVHADLDRLRLALGIETTGMEDTVYDMPSPDADALHSGQMQRCGMAQCVRNAAQSVGSPDRVAKHNQKDARHTE